LRELLDKVIEKNYKVIVVDDGSNDSTAEILKHLPIDYIKHPINRGQGAALKTGTILAEQLGYDAVIHFDADGQHRLEDVEKIIEQLNLHDIVLGSRYLGVKSDIPTKKRIILFLAKLFSKYLLGLGFTDPQNGLRAFKLSCFPDISWQKDDFQHCSEILSNISRKKLDYIEVPILINYTKYSANKTIKPQIKMGWKLIWNKLFN